MQQLTTRFCNVTAHCCALCWQRRFQYSLSLLGFALDVISLALAGEVVEDLQK